jgi:hypothetical protein
MDDEEKKRDYAVGYGKPPAHSRFKPGQKPPAGAGRPRGSRNRLTKMKQSLEATTPVRVGDKTMNLNTLDLALAHNRQQTSKGVSRAIDRTLKMQQEVEAEEAARQAAQAASEPGHVELTQEDEEILEDYLRYLKQLREAF